MPDLPKPEMLTPEELVANGVTIEPENPGDSLSESDRGVIYQALLDIPDPHQERTVIELVESLALVGLRVTEKELTRFIAQGNSPLLPVGHNSRGEKKYKVPESRIRAHEMEKRLILQTNGPDFRV